MEKSTYWDDIYKKKNESQQSWFQENPELSLKLINELPLEKSAKIIDIGAGESRLVDFLLQKGFKNISLLDISQEALEKTKNRLGLKANEIDFIASDVTRFKATHHYDLWHDRAVFHFLTDVKDIQDYLKVVNDTLMSGAHLIISTFSPTGPDKCSGLQISKYSQEELKKIFSPYFQNIKCLETTHTTPWGTKQDFVTCVFKKLA